MATGRWRKPQRPRRRQQPLPRPPQQDWHRTDDEFVASNSKTPQRVGGGGPGTTGPGQNGRNGFFNIAPEATQKVKLETVCLDYGHPTPRPAMKYEIRPVAAVTDKEGLAELCELLGRREIGHRAAQLAAWHLSNGMSWEKLAGLRTKQAIGTIPVLYERRNRRGEEGGREGRRLAQAAAGGRQTNLRRLGEVRRISWGLSQFSRREGRRP